MFQRCIQGSLCGMGSPRDAMPDLLNLYAAGRLKLDELVTRGSPESVDTLNWLILPVRASR
jgi:Zn-dependent alcohol dehydrogenase